MPHLVASSAERDEISVGIVAQLAPRRDVMDLKLVCGSAVLAAPAVALEHLPAQPAICLRVKP